MRQKNKHLQHHLKSCLEQTTIAKHSPFFFGVINPVNTPLIPAIFPFNKRSSVADTPRSIPPNKESHGIVIYQHQLACFLNIQDRLRNSEKLVNTYLVLANLINS